MDLQLKLVAGVVSIGPTVRELPGGTQVAEFRIVHNYKAASGKKTETFYQVHVYGDKIASVMRTVKKGFHITAFLIPEFVQDEKKVQWYWSLQLYKITPSFKNINDIVAGIIKICPDKKDEIAEFVKTYFMKLND